MSWSNTLRSLARKCRSSIARRGFLGSLQWVVDSRSFYLSKYCSPLSRLSIWCLVQVERLRFGTDTAAVVQLADLDIRSQNRRHGQQYQATRHRQFLKVLRALGINDHREWTFIDLGSGKGRVLLAAAAFPFAKIVGVEFSAELNAIARENIAKRLGRLRCQQIEVVYADAAEWQFPNGKMIVYLYNPFDSEVLARVLDNLETALRVHQQEAYVIYVTPAWKEIFDRSPLLRAVRSSGTISIYRTRIPGSIPVSQHDSPRGGTVLVLLAADRVTGPTKGLFQLFRHAGDAPWGFVLGLFHLCGAGPISECAQAAERLGVAHVILDQTRRFDPGLVWRAYRVVRAHGVTVLQSHSYKGHLLSLLLRLLTGLPWIAFAHGWTDEDRRIRLYNRLDFRLLRYPDRVVAVAESVRRRLEATGVPSSRITVIPNAVEIDAGERPVDDAGWRRRLGIPAGTAVLSVIGRLSPEKGQDVFLEACRFAAQMDCKFVGVLVGEGAWEKELRAKTTALGLESRVRFAGHCQDVAPVYAASDVIVIPSRSEGLPNVLLEAMASAKPVIATRVGGIPEVVSDGVNGRLVPPEDPVRLADAMAALLSDSQLRGALGERACVDVRSFSPRARAERILSVYASTVRRR